MDRPTCSPFYWPHNAAADVAVAAAAAADLCKYFALNCGDLAAAAASVDDGDQRDYCSYYRLFAGFAAAVDVAAVAAAAAVDDESSPEVPLYCGSLHECSDSSWEHCSWRSCCFHCFHCCCCSLCARYLHRTG